MRFEWDEDKAAANWAKHGVSFERAVEVFEDPKVLVSDDLRREYGEVRKIAVGRISRQLVVAVVHTDRQGITRLISARPASRKERQHYANR